jgi:predicted transcriptional regulator
MTELLEKAVRAAKSLPPTLQDEIARTILLLAEEESEPVPLTADERAAIAASKAAAERGEFATDEEVRAIWAKYGL